MIYRIWQVVIDVATAVVGVILALIIENWTSIVSSVGDAIPGDADEPIVAVVAAAVFFLLSNLRRELQRRMILPPTPGAPSSPTPAPPV